MRRPIISVVLTFSLLLGCNRAHRQIEKAERAQASGHVSEALRIYAQVTQSGGSSKQRSLAHARMAQCMTTLERYDEALQLWEQAIEEDGHNTDAQIDLANLFLAADEYGRAKLLLQSALAQKPQDERGIASLAAVYTNEKDFNAAEALYKPALERNPAAVELAIGYAQLLDDQQRPDEARKVLVKAAESVADSNRQQSANAWMAAARLEEQQGNLIRAELDYRRAKQVFDAEQTTLRLAQFYERAARLPEAKTVLEQSRQHLGDLELISGHAQEASQHYAAVLRTRRESSLQARWVESLILAGRSNEARQALANNSGAFDEVTRDILGSELALATEDIDRAFVLANSATNIAPASVAANFQLANVQIAKSDKDAAEHSLRTALATDRNYAPAATALARIRLQRGDAANAERLIAPVLQQEPANLNALATYADTLSAARKFDAAVRILERAVAINPDSAVVHTAAAHLADAQSNVAGALSEYQRALSADPHYADALDGLARLYQHGNVTRGMIRRLEQIALKPPRSTALLQLAARLYASQGAYEDAKRCLQEPQASLSQAQELQWRGKLSEAAAIYESALRQGEYSGVAANNLAWIYLKQEKLDRAFELSQAAQLLRPGDPNVMDTAALIHLRRREYQQAIGLLQQAVTKAQERHAEPEVIAAIRQHLRDAQASGKQM